jgi:hypothetical protein
MVIVPPPLGQLMAVLEVLPAGSVATHTTVVTPSGKHEPEGGVQTTVALQLSVAAGLVNVTVVQPPSVGATATALIGAQEITGGCVSLTVTVKVQVVVPPS